jgi:hypothetical protein
MNSLRQSKDNTKFEDEQRKEKTPTPEPKKEEPKPKLETPAPEVKSDSPPIKAKKKERPPLPTVAPKAEPAPAPVAAAAAPAPLDVSEDERDALEDTKDFARLLGDKYKELPAKTEKFLREKQARMQKLLKEGDDPSEDPDFQKWLRDNEPKVTAREFEQLRMARVKEQLRKERDPELDNLKHELYVRDELPKIKQESRGIYSKLAREALPDELKNELARLQKEHGPEKGVQEFQKSHGFEFEVADRTMAAATEDAELFISLTRENPSTGKPVVAFDPKNPSHVRVNNMVAEVCEAWKAAGGKSQIRDGKWFVTRDEWLAMPEAERVGFWTFNNTELLNVALAGVKEVITQAIAVERKRMEGRGFKRVVGSAPAAAAPQPAPQPTVSTSGRTSPVPPASSTPSPDGNPLVNRLLTNLAAGRNQSTE